MGLTDFIPVVGPLINGISNIVGSNQNLQAVRETNRANFELAQWQNDRAIENWQMQNEYNSPTQQMSRLADAGLNPNLIYGSGSSAATGNSGSAAPVASAPKMEAYQRPMNMLADIGGIAQGLLAIAGVQKTKAETDSIFESTKLTAMQRENVQMDIALKKLQQAKTEIEREYWRKEIATIYRIHDLTADDLQSRINFRDNDEHFLADSQIGLNNAKYVSEFYDLSLYDYRVKLMESQVKSYLASAAASQASAYASYNHAKNENRLTDAQLEKISADIVSTYIDAQGKMTRNDIEQVLLKNGINLHAGGLGGMTERGIYNLGKLLDKYAPLPF